MFIPRSQHVVIAAPPAPPKNFDPPTITGAIFEEQTLVAFNGTWTNATSFAYQWRRCNAAGGSCADISGATASTYVLVAGDVDFTIRVVVTATNGVGSTGSTSAQTTVVEVPPPLPPPPPFPPSNPPTNNVAPSVSGEMVEDQTIAASTGTWVDVISYAYQWRRCNAAGASCVDIAGATAATRVLAAADVGSTLRVVVTATNEDGSTEATSAQTAVVAAAPVGAGPPVNESAPTVTGTTTVGQTLNAGTGGWSGTAPITYAYQWRRCNAAGASCADIAGATGSAYTLQAADEDDTIRVRVTATNSGGSTSADSAASAVIDPVPAPASGFTNLSRELLGQGGVTKQGVYRGTTDGSEKFYVAHAYRSDTGDLVAINPAASYSHIAYPFPATGEEGAWAMAYHAVEKNLYLGTYLNGHILRFNTTTQAFTDLGATGLQYVWDMTYSPFNQKVYACGSNSSKLFRLDGSTIVDLGTINSSGGNQYARWMVADPNPANPYLYIGCGVNSAVLIAYNINTAAKTVLSTGGTGTFTVDRTEAGEVHAFYGNTHLKCSGGTTTAFPNYPANFDDNRFANGDHIDVTSGTTVISLSGGGTQGHTYAYGGKPMEMWRVGQGPDGKVYGSAAIPAWLTMLYDPATPATQETRIGIMGSGQIYSFLVNGSHLWMSQYGENHVFLKYNPAAAVTPDPFVAGGASSNPQTANGTSDWRPNCLINAPDGNIYSGTCGSYGQLSGRLIKIVPATRVTTVLTPYTNQGVNSLAATPTAALGIAGSWALIGATTIEGGAGTSPSASTAELFTVNPSTFAVVTKIALPITGIEDLAELVTDGTFMYAIGTDKTGSSKSYVFKYNHATNAFVGTGTLLPFTTLMYNTAVVYNGNIVGLCQQGVYSIPLANLAGGSVVDFPTWPAAHINAGGVFDAGTWYFTSGNELWEYVMP